MSENLLLHTAFEAQADRTPNAVAVVAGHRRLTYAELDARANRLARHLRALGVGPEVRVGLCLERDEQLLVAVLGALKAGGAYMPLDPAYPAERLGFLLADSRAPVLITQQALLPVLPRHEAEVVLLDADAARIDSHRSARPSSTVLPQNLSYFIYTSGSTGRPKGVAIAHQSAAALVRWALGVFSLEDLAGVALATSLCFDLSVFEIFVPLSTGGAVIVAADALGIPHLPAAGEVTLINTVPSAMAELVRLGLVPSSVRVVNLAGEALPGTLAKAIYQTTSAQRVYNLYGPSEDTTYSTWALIAAEDRIEPPIGRPIDGTQAWLVDENGRPVQAGEAGQIFLGGAGLARGYFDRPDLTADRFVPDPFSGEPGTRLYRTGDLGRELPDGSLHYLGRLDHQVKIHGFRIELGEIEAVLLRHPAVREVVAVSRETESGKQLVVYLTAEPSAPSPRELREHLLRTLPEFMAPSFYVRLDALPRTPNGKVDRTALPEPDRESAVLERERVAPRTPVEQRLAVLFRELLQVERPGVHDDFFALGGHSLLAGQLISRVRAELGVELPLRDVYSARTLASLAERVAVAGRPLRPQISRVPRDRPIPLSFQQEGVWFLNELTPSGNIAYNFQSTIRFRGALKAEVLEAAMTEVVRRHEVFRTRFPARDGAPVQEPLPPFPIRLPVVDLGSLPVDRIDEEAEALIGRELQRPFDLLQVPLVRWLLLGRGPEDHTLIQVEYHFVHDGWSFARLLLEIRELYQAFAADLPSPLPELPIQYADFAAWQRSWMQGEVLQRHLDPWLEVLAGAPSFLDLPADRPRPPLQSFRGALLNHQVSPDVGWRLRAFARERGATLFTAMFAGFALLMHRLSGEDDLVVGTATADRPVAELEPVIGMMVNMLPLRIRFTGSPSFAELTERVQAIALDAYTWQEVPLERLVKALSPVRDPSRNPLFQVMFSFHDSPVPDLDFGDLHGELTYRHNGSAKNDLNVIGIPRAEQRVGRERRPEDDVLTLRWEYAVDLFDEATLRRWMEQYERLLGAALDQPNQCAAELPLLSAEEARQVLVEWNRTGMPLPDGICVHQLVARRAAEQPDALAVAGEDGSLTYAELVRRAGLLASRLRRMGVESECRVGVFAERSPEMVTGLLAVLNAGGAYLPIDPAYPADRISLVLDDARAPVLLTTRRMLDRVPAYGGRVLLLDEEIDGPAGPLPEVAPGQLAYVIYTSGSTGRPKGVQIEHRSLLNLVEWHRREYGISPSDRATLVASPGFDASVWEVWPYLASGASLHVPSESVRSEPSALAAWLARERITISFLPTPLAEAALEEPWPGGALRFLLTGGDALHRGADESAPFALVNHYGPTENTVVATAAPVARGAQRPPIGRPIANVRVHVLDSRFQAQPAGVPGELFVGGSSLARGYLDRPDLTAERFVPDPFGEGRLYRTGDRVRYLPDGSLDFLGRVDFQVKVRGFRIELGEVEAALREHPAVSKAAATVWGDPRCLIAYVAAQDRDGLREELQELLASRLPSYMVPSAFVVLPELPLGPHGKIDRAALPAPEMETESVAPRTPLERRLAGMWADLLPGGPVGAHDGFFERGGHSLLATRLLARVGRELGVSVPLGRFLQSPTVAELASRVEEARGIGSRTLVRAAGRERYPLSFPQQRLWFMDRLAPNNHTYNIPEAFALRGRLDAAALSAALSGIVDRHEVLRTRFVESEGQPWQEVLPPGAFAFLPVLDLSGLRREIRERELARIGREEAARPFVLSRGPLLRGGLVRTGQEEHVLLITLHHIASDGWSAEILYRELSLLYDGSPLPELPVQYADFALWQRSWLEEVMAAQLEWWTRRLAGLENLEVSTDRPRPPVQTFRGETAGLAVPPALTRALRDLSSARRSTLFITLLASWQALFHRVTGQRSVAVGSPVANRNQPEVEGLIGFFVNLLALRTDCGGDPPFGELLERVRGTALEAYDHADVPFELLIDELGLERDLSRQALVQVMFALHMPPPVPALRGLETEPLQLAGAVAKFDLTLVLLEQGEGLDGWIEYNTDLFDRSTVVRLAGWFLNLLASAVEPGRRLSELELESPAERHQVLGEWNDTAAPFPEQTRMHQFFEAAVDRAPEALAAAWEQRELTYAGLEERANRIAQLLRQRGVERGTPVGIWMERSLDMVAGVLAVLKAGACYVPLDPFWPADRVEAILRGMEAPAVLTRSAHLGRLLDMQWRLPALTEVVCLDVETPEPAPEPVDAESVCAVFDLVAERAVDRITAGGFIHDSTGEVFSETEVDEYRDRVLGLAAPWIGPGKRALEIGCGSGLLLWEIAPRVARCVGLDPSPLTQERNRARAAELGLDVELPVGFAHEVEDWAAGSFDLVLIASTAQFFPGQLYLERVVKLARRLLAPGGALVIADVPDARHRQDLRKVLSVDEGFFLDLGAAVHHRETGFDNELRFRYDVVLTQGTSRERGKHLLTSWHVDRCPAARPASAGSPEDLAYVIHTSGSTGQPKGIAVQHRAVANLIQWINPMLGIGPSDRVLFVTSLCFDLSVWDVFGVLAAGGCVRVASEEEVQDPERLVKILVEEPVTIWDSAPAALVRLAPLFPSEPAAHSRLRRVMLSGDWIPVTLPDRVRAAFPYAAVTALGGATEATVWSNWYPVGRVDPDWPSIPYGRPMPNAQYRVLDAGLSPCPVGVPGDLYIGGDCLCVGYAHQPDLTAAAFVPDPFGRPGGRLYRTGDRARTFADGNLEFLGRIDHQVKIRGFRIELGEIEVALARHPGVREAVVLAREDVPGDKRLVAYVVASAGELPDLRDFLRRSLPDYMIPAAFVELAALPVTPNGKLDRNALPAPRRAETDGSAAPRTPTELALAALWRELLGVEHAGVHDSFFELGGHSLLATQLVARMRETFRVEVPLRGVFQAPTLGELAAAIDAAEQGTAGPVLHTVPRQGDLPLSASQLRQWFLVQLEPGTVDYNLPVTVALEGDLDVPSLRSALREIVRRHEALRTVFVSLAGRPAAVVVPEIDLPLPVLDLSSTPGRNAAILRAVTEDSERPFDLARGPLLRALLIRLSNQGHREHLLALTFHHIVFDGFSAGVFLHELAALYEGEDLPALPVQYLDYAVWQQEQLRSPAMRAKLDCWKERLAGASQALELPLDRPRPSMLGLRGEMVPVTLPPAETAEIRKLASRESATLFMTLLAGYASLLSRYTGQEDLNVGTFVANRPQPALERLIGFFVNTLVLRLDLAGDPSFRELLARVRETALEAFENQDVPFESLLEELEIGRDLSRNPLFQVMFGLQNFAVPTLEVPGLTFRPVSLLDHTRTNGDLGFWMWEEDDALTSLLQLNAAILDRSTVLRMYRHMARLLAASAADPGLRLSELPLLSGEETAQIVVEWNLPGERETAPDDLVHERFEHWARARPDAIALETADGKEILTYAELNRRANHLAHHLRRLGVRTDSIVAIWAERSVEFVAGVLGVLKAGGAYMPLDPSLPEDRLAAILRGSGASVLPARDGFEPALPQDDLDPEPWAVPESLAYVLFTSGTTGVPKGVLVGHGALASFAETARRLYGVGPEDRVLQFSSLVFDISVEEIFTSWAAGAALVLRDDEMIASPARFLRACGELNVQMVDLPTAYWHELGVELAHGNVSLPRCVRSVIFAGERALADRLSGWQTAMRQGVRLFNSYGPSETAPASSVFDPSETAAGVSTNGLPIGRPMRGARLYVADFGLHPAPPGVAGELLIGGASLGRGYAGRPDLTAERFVPSPFADAPGERVYRTGDRVRWLRDGNLEFLGRLDDQVKIRGFRVEPGEVAAVLCRYAGVHEAVVMARTGTAGLRLVAYAAAEPRVSAAELRTFVKKSLPAYMVPSDFELLEALPLTATGKVDRNALPEPSTVDGEDYAPPETPTEEILAGIWAQVLGRERIGIFDNFFDLGGHSLLAPQIFARIEDTLQVDLPLRVLFEAPTVAQLATAVERELLAQIEELSDEEAERLLSAASG